MYSSTSSSAYPSRSGVGAQSSRHRGERLSSGPLTNERNMMEEIRLKLERAQRRIASGNAMTASQHGYDSSRAGPRSMGIQSSSSYRHHHHHPRHGYESSSSRHVHSRSTHHHHHANTSIQDDVDIAPMPDYRSERAPAVRSFYLEDLATAITSNHGNTAPISRAPTSYVPGSRAPPSYYAPDESTISSNRPTTRRVSSQHYEHAPMGMAVPVRSERHAVYTAESHHHDRLKPSEKSSTRQYSHLDRTVPRERQRTHRERVPQPPPSTRGTSTRGIMSRKNSPPPGPPSATIPYYGGEDAPPSLAFDSSDYILYAESHGSVPLSSSTSYRRQPLSSNGQPERSALKQPRNDAVITPRARDENDTADTVTSETAAVAPAPPSSRVRFQDELQEELLRDVGFPPLVEEDEYVDDSDQEPIDFTATEPYDPKEDGEYLDQGEDQALPFEPYSSQLEPIIEVTQASPVNSNGHEVLSSEEKSANDAFAEKITSVAVSTPQNNHPTRASTDKHSESSQPTPRRRGSSANPSDADEKTRSTPSSPHHHQQSRPSFDKYSDMPPPPPHRRRGSSAARTPTNLSPSSGHARKSLTEPPKSAIDASTIAQFDLDERRASRVRRPSNANRSGGDVDGVNTKDKSISSYDQETRMSTEKLPSSPIAVYAVDSYSDYGDYPSSPRHSMGSLHESDLAFSDEDDEIPSLTFTKSDRSIGATEKPSPSSSEDYADARAFSDGDDMDEEKAASAVHKIPSSGEPNMPTAVPHSVDATSEAPTSTYQNFWEYPDQEEDSKEEEPEIEPGAGMKALISSPQPIEPPAQDDPVPTAPKDNDDPKPPSPVEVEMSLHDECQPEEGHSLQYLSMARQRVPSKPMPLSQSMMMLAPPSTTRSSHRPPPMSTHIRPSPATARMSSSNMSSSIAPRAPLTASGALAGSTYVPRRLRPKDPVSQRKALPPSIGALSGLASGPVIFELNVQSFYEIVWHTGEFGFSFQRVYLEDTDESGAPTTRRMFLRMLLNTERGTCPSFKEVHVGDVLIEIGGTRVCDIKLDQNGGGAALTKLFTELRAKTPLRLVFQRMDPTSWEGGVEL